MASRCAGNSVGYRRIPSALVRQGVDGGQPRQQVMRRSGSEFVDGGAGHVIPSLDLECVQSRLVFEPQHVQHVVTGTARRLDRRWRQGHPGDGHAQHQRAPQTGPPAQRRMQHVRSTLQIVAPEAEHPVHLVRIDVIEQRGQRSLGAQFEQSSRCGIQEPGDTGIVDDRRRQRMLLQHGSVATDPVVDASVVPSGSRHGVPRGCPRGNPRGDPTGRRGIDQ